MRKLLMGLALTLSATAGASGVAAASQSRTQTASPNQVLEWPNAPANARYRVGSITLTMRNVVSGSDNEELNRVLTIQAQNLPPLTVDTDDDNFEPAVMVVTAPSGEPTILWQTYSGGAHCCTTIDVISPRNGRLEAVTIYEGDGGPMEEAPRDLDGDGRLDFRRYDNAFLYTFASYAESFAPPVIYNVVDGQAVDVSTRPGFRSLFEEEARRARQTCVSSESNRNGACAAYVAASARIGRFDASWAEMLRHWDREAQWELPTGCRVSPATGACPDDQTIRYSDYPAALRAFLVETGYITR